MVNVHPKDLGKFPCPVCKKKNTTFTDATGTLLFCLYCHKSHYKRYD